MNIFIREIKSNFKSFVIWSIILTLLIMVAVGKFSAFAGNPEMLSMLDSIPPAVLDAMNMRAFNLTTLSGFFGVMFLYFSLMGAIAGAMWGSTIISKEERDKTVEFSLVLPVSRNRVVTAKALAALFYCVALVLFTWVISLISVRDFAPDAAFYKFLAVEMQAMFLIELIFLAIGLLLGCAMKQNKRSGSVAISIILITYFLSVITEIQDKMDFLKYLTPFKYFDASDLYQNVRVESLSLILTVGIVLISLVAAYLTYNKRDLYI